VVPEGTAFLDSLKGEDLFKFQITSASGGPNHKFQKKAKYKTQIINP